MLVSIYENFSSNFIEIIFDLTVKVYDTIKMRVKEEYEENTLIFFVLLFKQIIQFHFHLCEFEICQLSKIILDVN